MAAKKIGALLAEISGGLFQQAYVVSDLQPAQQAMRESLGCSEFVNLPAADLDSRGVATCRSS